MSRGKVLQRYAPSPVPPALGPDLLPWLAREFQRLAQVQEYATWDGLDGEQPPPASHDHLEANITDLDRLRWQGVWEAGAYERNDVVKAGRWLMVATADTEDPAEPEGAGVAWQLDPEPTWTPTTATVEFGLRLPATDAILYGVRVQIPTTGAVNVYLVADGVRIDVAMGATLPSDTWVEWYIRPILITGETDLIVEADSYVEEEDYLVDNPLRGLLDDVASNTIYGADMLLDYLTPSADWDALSWQA